MDNETKLNIEKWNLKLDHKIKCMHSLESNITFILTQKSFYVYEKNKDLLTQNIIPLNEKSDSYDPNPNFESSNIWSDKKGIHVIFKLNGTPYYYNNILPENKKVTELDLEYKDKLLEPFSFAFNNNNQETKTTDEIIFTDSNSSIYTFIIKINETGEIQEKVNKVFDFTDKSFFTYQNNAEEINKENKEKEEKLNEILGDDKLFRFDKDDKICDIKLYVNEEIIGTGKKAVVNKSYFILAVSKRLIFQFSGKNSISEIFLKYKNDRNKLDKDEFLKDSKIFPKVNNINLKKTRIQIFTSKDKKVHYYWNNECGFCQWQMIGTPLPLPQKEFNLYNYIKLKNDGTYEKNPCPIMCCLTSKCIYFLYNDCLILYNTLTDSIIHVENFREEFLDIYYNQEMKRLILYSYNNIIKISLEHESKNLWKDYIEKGEYNLSLKYFSLDDRKIEAKLHKLNGDLYLKKKDYDSAALEYALSDEDFEHICLKFSKLNDLNPLINYLSFVKQFRLSNNDDNNSDENFIEKYLINTWQLELMLDNEDINKSKDKNYEEKGLESILFDSSFNGSTNYIDKEVIFKALQNYGRYKDYIDFAARKNDYQSIIFDLVNHNKFKEAIDHLILYMSYSTDEKYLKDLIKIFLTYINIFTIESPKEVIDLITKYYYLIENPFEIIRIINNIDIYNSDIFEENYDNILNLIKKLINVAKKNNKKKDKENNFDYDSLMKNLVNLYILYLSLSPKVSEFNELVNYFKTLVTNSIAKNIYAINQEDNKIYFEISFVKNIVKSKLILALIYCLKKEYSKSIYIALNNNNTETAKDIAIFIVNTISDPKKKKEIWLDIFNHFKSSSMNIIEEILNKSEGVLGILDILPHLMGNVQLKTIKNDLKNCINIYERKLKKLKMHINDYGFSSKLLNQKAIKESNNGRKYLKLKFEDISCAVCGKDLKESNFYLFPCNHSLDFDCLINTLLYYDVKKIGDETFKKKMLGIKQIINEIRQLNLKQKNILERKTTLLQKQKKQNVITGIFRTLTSAKIDVEDEDFSPEEENQLQDLENALDKLLSEECPLCGDEMIFSTQIKFVDEDIDDWKV